MINLEKRGRAKIGEKEFLRQFSYTITFSGDKKKIAINMEIRITE